MFLVVILGGDAEPAIFLHQIIYFFGSMVFLGQEARFGAKRAEGARLSGGFDSPFGDSSVGRWQSRFEDGTRTETRIKTCTGGRCPTELDRPSMRYNRQRVK